jgi:sugar phosphate isomerase/epimerase
MLNDAITQLPATQHGLKIGAVTDEFSSDLAVAADVMRELELNSAELRMVWGKNVVDLSPQEIREAKDVLSRRGLDIAVVASPLFKCDPPETAEMDTTIERDVFGAAYTFAEQSAVAERAFSIANELGAHIVRVFSFWRVLYPNLVFDRIVRELRKLAGLAERSNVMIALENEQACNAGTSAEAAAIVSAVDRPNMQILWDPANSLASGQRAYPDGFRSIPASKLAHVHVKDCRLIDGVPEWCCLGEGEVEWKEIIRDLKRKNFQGRVHLETHWRGTNGNKVEASRACANILRDMNCSSDTQRRYESRGRAPT